MAGQGQTQEIGVGKASDSRRQRHRCLRRGAEETLCEARHPAAAPGTLDEGIEVHAVDAAFDDIADGLAVGGGAGLVIAGAGEGGVRVGESRECLLFGRVPVDAVPAANAC